MPPSSHRRGNTRGRNTRGSSSQHDSTAPQPFVGVISGSSKSTTSTKSGNSTSIESTTSINIHTTVVDVSTHHSSEGNIWEMRRLEEQRQQEVKERTHKPITPPKSDTSSTTDEQPAFESMEEFLQDTKIDFTAGLDDEELPPIPRQKEEKREKTPPAPTRILKRQDDIPTHNIQPSEERPQRTRSHPRSGRTSSSFHSNTPTIDTRTNRGPQQRGRGSFLPPPPPQSTIPPPKVSLDQRLKGSTPFTPPVIQKHHFDHPPPQSTIPPPSSAPPKPAPSFSSLSADDLKKQKEYMEELAEKKRQERLKEEEEEERLRRQRLEEKIRKLEEEAEKERKEREKREKEAREREEREKREKEERERAEREKREKREKEKREASEREEREKEERERTEKQKKKEEATAQESEFLSRKDFGRVRPRGRGRGRPSSGRRGGHNLNRTSRGDTRSTNTSDNANIDSNSRAPRVDSTKPTNASESKSTENGPEEKTTSETTVDLKPESNIEQSNTETTSSTKSDTSTHDRPPRRESRGRGGYRGRGRGTDGRGRGGYRGHNSYNQRRHAPSTSANNILSSNDCADPSAMQHSDSIVTTDEIESTQREKTRTNDDISRETSQHTSMRRTQRGRGGYSRGSRGGYSRGGSSHYNKRGGNRRHDSRNNRNTTAPDTNKTNSAEIPNPIGDQITKSTSEE